MLADEQYYTQYYEVYNIYLECLCIVIIVIMRGTVSINHRHRRVVSELTSSPGVD